MQAKDILKEIGYVAPKFDSNGFLQTVGEFFLSGTVEQRLLLIPYRFANIEWETLNLPEPTDCDMSSPYGFTKEDVAKGFKAETATHPYWGIQAACNYDETNRVRQEEAGILVPRIIIDKPFFENAAQMLRVMCGYIVEKKMKRHTKLYNVSLI